MGAPPLSETLDALGYVQLDSIRNVVRAHHHILWSRDQSYRPRDLHRFAYEQRGAFEHFSHDACLLPMSTWPVWQRRLEQFRRTLPANKWFERVPDAAGREAILARIRQEGPLCSADFDHGGPRSKAMWERPPTKLALDFLWCCGALSTAHRTDFRKFYDLSERIVPAALRETEMRDADRIDWLCRGALDRLGFATPGEIKRFWEACSTQDVRGWIADHAHGLVEVEVDAADGTRRHAFAPADIETRLAALDKPTSRLRVLNPFDPAVRDRKRLLMLFGFDYVNEIFVPRAKRRWGYYVYPVLDCDRMVARIDLSGGPKTGLRPIRQQWVEDGVRWSARRQARLEAEV
ncbi:MAG: crosslink repair DNA glycosylase YcaQ family protein, partial [Litorimonas sp.]